jgi:hypothetical protein
MIELARLCDWSLGLLPEEAAAEVEAHLFECDECTRTATFLLEAAARVPELVRQGHVHHVTTMALVRRMREDGLEIRHYEVSPGETVACSASVSQAYGTTRLEADLTGIESLTLEVKLEDGTVLDRVEDVPFDAREGAVLLAYTGDEIRSFPTMVLCMRLEAVDGAGRARELASYRLSHTALP